MKKSETVETNVSQEELILIERHIMLRAAVGIVVIIVFLGLRISHLGFAGFLSQALPDCARFFFWIFALFPALFVAWLATYTLFRIVVAVISLAKQRKPRVFVSFHHSLQQRASNIAQALSSYGLEPLMLDMKPREHDEVIQQVLALLKQASAVIGVTSEVRGFYESEILVAANCHKPIILIADEATSGVPATAFSGHPVFDNTSLEKLRYEPLARLIHYAVGDRASVQFMRRRAVEETFDAAANWVNVLMRHSRLFGFVGVPLIAMGGYLLGANSGGDFAFLVSLLRLLLFVVVFLWPIVRLMWSFVTGTRLRRIVAQKIQTQQLTNKLLLELLTSKEDRNILSSLRNLAGTSLPA